MLYLGIFLILIGLLLQRNFENQRIMSCSKDRFDEILKRDTQKHKIWLKKNGYIVDLKVAEELIKKIQKN